MKAGNALDEGLAVVTNPFGEGTFGLEPAASHAVGICGALGFSIDELRGSRVTGFTVKDKSWDTGAGISVGSSLRELREAYPELRDLDPDMYGVTTPHGYGLQFSVPNGIVDTIGVGEGLGEEVIYDC